MIDVALRFALHDRGKFFITLIGVAFAVTLVFVQVGLFRGLLGNATVLIEHAHADIWITSKNTPNIDFPHYFTETAVARVRGVEGVERADNFLVVFAGMQLPTGSEETMVVCGIDDVHYWGIPWALDEGVVDPLRTGRTMTLDQSAERRFGPFSVGDYREVFGRRLRIVGKTRGALSFTTMPMAFTSLRVAQELQPVMYAGKTAYILVKLQPGANSAQVADELRAALPYNDVYTRDAWAARSRDYWIVSTGLGLNMALTVFLGILVGVTVVAQTLYSAALDHAREFGTLKAIGAPTRHISGLLATQALIAAVLGFVIAMPCVLGVRALARSMALEVVLSADVGVIVFFGTVVLCMAASMFTYRKIASIDPALVFRA